MADIIDDHLHIGVSDQGRNIHKWIVGVWTDQARSEGLGQPDWVRTSWGDTFSGWRSLGLVERDEGWTPEIPRNKLTVRLIDGATPVGHTIVRLDPLPAQPSPPTLWERLVDED